MGGNQSQQPYSMGGPMLQQTQPQQWQPQQEPPGQDYSFELLMDDLYQRMKAREAAETIGATSGYAADVGEGFSF